MKIGKKHAALAAAVLIALLLAGCAAQASPTPATLQNTDIPVTSSSPEPSATPLAEPTAMPAATEAQPAPSATQVVPSTTAGGVEFVIVPEQSEARYRVTEQLANRDLPNDAVGRTNQISGSVVLSADGQIDPAKSKITVDVSTLATDQNMRDNYVRRNILQTDQYPQAVFVPREVSGLSFPLPESGQVSFEVTGDLTVRDVTKPVTWTVSGTVSGDQAVGTASTSFNFAEFNLSQPRVPVVLSVEDRITLEADVTLQRAQP